MVEEVFDRHARDLNGRLRPFNPSSASTVRLILPRKHAHRPGAQHLLWMLVNQLARASGVISTVFVDAPEDVSTLPFTVPSGDGTGLLSRVVKLNRAV